MDVPATAHGRATRERIVDAAARLMAERGPAATSLDDVRAAASASKSQLYHYFGDKHGLVQAVVRHQCAAVLRYQAERLRSVERLEDLDAWGDGMARDLESEHMRGGCPIGTLAAELADSDEASRGALADALETWRLEIAAALERLRGDRLLDRDADVDALATGMLAAIQGGLLLAKTARDSAPLRLALQGGLAQIRAPALARAHTHARTRASARAR